MGNQPIIKINYFVPLFDTTQSTCFICLETFSELSKILHQCHTLCSEMVHFIQQTQYYISFEVSQNQSYSVNT